MKNSLRSGNCFFALFCSVAALTFFGVERAKAVTSPYVTVQTNVPLNQATNDSINGVLPYFNSDTPQEGQISYFSDATSASAPNANVIAGPDNTWIGVAWDFGDPGPGYYWRLDRIDLWIAASDNLRKGIQADFSVSNSGDPGDFTIIPNSKHWAGLSQNSLYNKVRWDFPDHFIAGATTNDDRYAVTGFRYLRLNSRGDSISGTDWQSRFVEMDAWVTKVGTAPSVISTARNNGGDVNLVWTTVSGASYDVEFNSNLMATNWLQLTNVLADSETASATDTGTTNAFRFYRVVLRP